MEEKKTNKLFLTLVAPLLFVLLWSSGAIVVKLGLHDSTPFGYVAIRFFLSTAIMWSICILIKSPIPRKLAQWRYIILTGLLLQAGYQIFFFLSLDFDISPGVLSIILGAQPILTAISSKNKTSVYQWTGLLLGISGLTFVVGSSLFVGKFTIAGIGYAILSLACITVGTLMQKRITVSMPTNMAIQYTGGAAALLILTPLVEKTTISWTFTFWFALLWMTLVISIGASMLLFYMIQKGNLTKVTSLFYCVPPLTALLDYFIYGHKLSIASIVGMGIIIVGLILVNKQGLIKTKVEPEGKAV
ncbi:DMT family transporter [Mesobacillus zeae]|uniref:DMT family transporter n=1 Tax=Mesobacillus zeae TaxID=1917180 RepID=UPI00115CE794|nr:DMT family transporter [Mesobacillus zeae]